MNELFSFVHRISGLSYKSLNTLLLFKPSGQVSYDTALSVNAYLGKEVEYVPWYSALNNLGYLENMFTRSSGYGNLKVGLPP